MTQVPQPSPPATSSKTVVALLSVIAAAAIVIAVVLVVKVLNQSHPWKEDAARRDARENFITGAQYRCTLSGVVPGMTGLDDPRYLACVRDDVKTELEGWDATHPSDAPPDGLGYDHLN